MIPFSPCCTVYCYCYCVLRTAYCVLRTAEKPSINTEDRNAVAQTRIITIHEEFDTGRMKYWCAIRNRSLITVRHPFTVRLITGCAT